MNVPWSDVVTEERSGERRRVYPSPEDVVCEARLARELARLQLSELDLARRLGLSLHGCVRQLAVPRPGFRQQTEHALGLEPGALRLA